MQRGRGGAGERGRCPGLGRLGAHHRLRMAEAYAAHARRRLPGTTTPLYMCPHKLLLYMCPHTAVYMCPRTTVYVCADTCLQHMHFVVWDEPRRVR